MENMLTFHILNVYVDQTQPRQFKFTFKPKWNSSTFKDFQGCCKTIFKDYFGFKKVFEIFVHWFDKVNMQRRQ